MSELIRQSCFSILPVGEGWRPCPELLTADEAVGYLRLDVDGPKDPQQTLRYYRDKGLLKAVQVGKRLRYRREDLDDFLRSLSGKDC